MTFTRAELGQALLVAFVVCLGCSSTDTDGDSPSTGGQSGGQGGRGGAGTVQSGGVTESADAGAGEDNGGSAGEGNEAGMNSGGTGQASTGGASSSAGTGGSAGIAGNATAGAMAAGGSSGRNECVWEAASTDKCPVCGASDGCLRPSYKYVGSGAITSSCCGLEWQEETAPAEYTWSKALEYCASLSLLGGGWRLPSIAELYSLVDLSDESHTTPSIAIDAFADTARALYWSSSLDGNSGQAAWGVNFSDGASQSVGIDEQHPHRVRCVR